MSNSPNELKKLSKLVGSMSIEVSKILPDRLNSGGKLITFGNGGSAADAQHFAPKLSRRFLRERRPFPAIALSTSTSSLTAIGNDYDYSRVFSRQIDGICTSIDIVIKQRFF